MVWPGVHRGKGAVMIKKKNCKYGEGAQWLHLYHNKLDGVAPLITDPPPTSYTTLIFFIFYFYFFF